MYHGNDQINLSEALRYAEFGYKVFPVWGVINGKCLCGGIQGCKSGKHPWGAMVPHGVKDATTDPDLIRKWFPAAAVNVGISISGFAVLDVDYRSGGLETLAAWTKQYGAMPITPTVKSGGGGWHYYFQPLNMDLKQLTVLGDGVELLVSGCVIAPPGNHESGNQYQWIEPLELPLAEMPAWLVEKIKAVITLIPTPENAKPFTPWDPMSGVWEQSGETFATLGQLPGGQRQGKVISVIGSMFACGFTEEQVIEQGVQWARKQTPPYSESDLMGKIKHRAANRSEVVIEEIPAESLAGSPVRSSQPVQIEDSHQPPVEPNDRLHSDAFIGLAGEVVKSILPHTEADEVSLLLNFLVSFGNAVGHKAYFQVSGDYHHTNLFALTVGGTSMGKGLGWGAIYYLFSEADKVWAANIMHGIGSGEGLIESVQDDDQRAVDKRKLVLETEFSKLLKLKRRENATLSETLIDAYDCRVLFRGNRKDNALKSTNSHISILGHITPEILKSIYGGKDTADLFNGFANRFLFANVGESKDVRRPPKIQDVASHLVQPVRDALASAKGIGECSEGEDAMPLWDEVYRSLKNRVKAAERGRSHVRRLSMIYALLDGSSVLRLQHLKAALAIWRYCEATALELFGSVSADGASATAEPLHAKLLNLIRSKGADGINGRDAWAEFSNRGNPNAELKKLEESGFICKKDRRWYLKESATGVVGNPSIPTPCEPANSANCELSDERGLLRR